MVSLNWDWPFTLYGLYWWHLDGILPSRDLPCQCVADRLFVYLAFYQSGGAVPLTSELYLYIYIIMVVGVISQLMEVKIP